MVVVGAATGKNFRQLHWVIEYFQPVTKQVAYLIGWKVTDQVGALNWSSDWWLKNERVKLWNENKYWVTQCKDNIKKEQKYLIF